MIVADKLPKGFRFGVEYWRGEHVAAMPLDAPLVRFSPSALAFQRRKSLVSVQPVRVDSPHDWRTSLRRYLDWEKVTPIDAIRTDSFRGWVKRTLRRASSPDAQRPRMFHRIRTPEEFSKCPKTPVYPAEFQDRDVV